LNDTSNYILTDLGNASNFIRILYDYSISSSIFINNQNKVWCVSNKEEPNIISFSLNDSLLSSKDMLNDHHVVSYALSQNYPNPFNLSTIITYEIPSRGLVSLKIYDLLGREVETLVNEEKSPGRYEVKFDGSGLASGIYFYRITTNNFTGTKKMLLMK
jgi:hypothetical protein